MLALNLAEGRRMIWGQGELEGDTLHPGRGGMTVTSVPHLKMKHYTMTQAETLKTSK